MNNEHKLLFGAQLQALKTRSADIPNMPLNMSLIIDGVVDVLHKQQTEVLERARTQHGYLPFVPVIPHAYLPVNVLIKMVYYSKSPGWTDVITPRLSDVISTPDTPYYLFDIELGERLEGITPQHAALLLDASTHKRRPLTTAETIAVLIQRPDILYKRYLDATGSRYDDTFVPTIIRQQHRATLIWRSATEESMLYGTPSCAA